MTDGVCQNIFYFDSLLCPAHRELGSVPKHQKQEMSLPLLTFLFSEHCPPLETPRTGSSIYFWGPLQRCEISFFEVTRVVEAVQQNLDDSPKIIIAILPKLYMNLQKVTANYTTLCQHSSHKPKISDTGNCRSYSPKFSYNHWKLDILIPSCTIFVEWVEPVHKDHRHQQTLILINARPGCGSELLWINNLFWHKARLWI